MADFSDITDGDINGNGVFDVAMRSVKAHLLEEYQSQRITGAEYAQVYTNSLQATLTQVIQWQLGADIAENNAALIAAQILKVQAEITLVEAQIDKIEAEILLIPKQGDLIDQQILTQQAQVKLIEQQVLTEVVNTATAQFNLDNMLPQQLILLVQKTITEQAQTESIINGVQVSGIIGKQVELYAKQIDGYDRDAEQKMIRLMTDTWGIGITSDVDAIPDGVSIDKISDSFLIARNNADIVGPNG